MIFATAKRVRIKSPPTSPANMWIRALDVHVGQIGMQYIWAG